MRSPTPGRWTTSAISPTFSPESHVRTAPSSARDAASVDSGAAAPTLLERYRAQLHERGLQEDVAQLAVVVARCAAAASHRGAAGWHGASRAGAARTGSARCAP